MNVNRNIWQRHVNNSEFWYLCQNILLWIWYHQKLLKKWNSSSQASCGLINITILFICYHSNVTKKHYYKILYCLFWVFLFIKSYTMYCNLHVLGLNVWYTFLHSPVSLSSLLQWYCWLFLLAFCNIVKKYLTLCFLNAWGQISINSKKQKMFIVKTASI